MPHCGGLASLEPRVLGLQVRVMPGSEDAGSSTYSPTFRDLGKPAIMGSAAADPSQSGQFAPHTLGPSVPSPSQPDCPTPQCGYTSSICCIVQLHVSKNPGQHRHASLVSAGLAQRVRGSEGLTLAPRGGSCLATSSCNLFMYLFLCALRGSEFLVHKLAKVVLRALPLHWLPLCRFPTSVLSRLTTRAFSAVAFSSVESERQQDPPHR